MNPTPHDRIARYSDLVPESALSLPILILGVGAVGHHLSLLLSSAGFSHLIVYDSDTVSPENLGPQLFRPDQLGKYKTRATHDDCLSFNPSMQVTEHSNFPSGDAPPYDSLVFHCTDSMDVRKDSFERLANLHGLPFFDSRVGAETIHILSALDHPSKEYYATTLFPASESEPVPCTSRMSPYTASIAASLLFSRFANHLRGNPVIPHFILNLQTLDSFIRGE